MKTATQTITKSLYPLISAYPWNSTFQYANWLSQQYYIVRHSTPMLALSCGRAINNQPYHKRCIEHLAEERGHDKMLLNDLKLIGSPLLPELPATKAFYSTQYYVIEHENPVAFLGYILFLEALATTFGRETLQKLNRGTTFLHLHAEEDDSHLDKAFAMIEALPANDQKAILQNLEVSARSYRTMLEDLSAMKPVKNSAAA